MMIKTLWNEIPIHYNKFNINKSIVMPNHIHGIIQIKEGQPQGGAPTVSTLSLSDIVHRFKTLTTKLYIDGVNNNDWLQYNKKLWQRNYYEHIIRNDYELNKIKEYIINNPLKWESDIENTS